MDNLQFNILGEEVETQFEVIRGRKKTPTMQELFGVIEGKTCKTCDHCFGYQQSRVWYKCELWLELCFPHGGHSEASDIRLKNQACGKYLEKDLRKY